MIENFKTDLPVGTLCNFMHSDVRLIYLGYNFSGNGRWHQFAKLNKWHTVWSEVLPIELNLLEISEPTTDKYQYWGNNVFSAVLFKALSKELEESPTMPTGDLMDYVAILGEPPIFGDDMEYKHTGELCYLDGDDLGVFTLPSSVNATVDGKQCAIQLMPDQSGNGIIMYAECTWYSEPGKVELKTTVHRLKEANNIRYVASTNHSNDKSTVCDLISFTKPE